MPASLPVPQDQFSAISSPSIQSDLGLPVPSLLPDGAADLVRSQVAISVVSQRLRVANRLISQRMGWRPGQKVSYRIDDGLVIIGTDQINQGRYKVDSRGHFRLPATARHAANIEVGDQLLLVALPEQHIVAVFPPAVLRHALGRWLGHVGMST